MFDNLRQDAESSPFYEEEDAAKLQPVSSSTPFFESTSSRRILGMTGVQRFMITLLMFLAVCLIGGMALLVLGRVSF
jgi:hypothetical protein